jgi:hypothetical protein
MNMLLRLAADLDWRVQARSIVARFGCGAAQSVHQEIILGQNILVVHSIGQNWTGIVVHMSRRDVPPTV